MLANGDFLFFSNGAYNSADPSYAYEYSFNTSGTMSATQVDSYKSSGNAHSDSLGDVQRLPNGNTLSWSSTLGGAFAARNGGNSATLVAGQAVAS